MGALTSHSWRFNSMPSICSANPATSSSLCISLMAWASLPCRRSPTALTKYPWARALTKSSSSSRASFSVSPKLPWLASTASAFSASVSASSSNAAMISTRNSDLSCGFVSSKSFWMLRSHVSTSSRSFCTSAATTFGWLRSLRTLLCNKPLFVDCTKSAVTASSMPKKVGTQFVRVEISSLPNSPFSAICCLMNMFAHRETIRTMTFCCLSGAKPRMPPTCGLAAVQVSRTALSWQVTAFHA
mmetsp:Transcript_43994/g.133244  ORF Transcript_43994/g.133244 Transcript_43994/m.133244 type:complete len:243 (-) Transcript_43994:1038-1766(-)